MNAASWLDVLPASGSWREALLTRGPRVAVWVLAIVLAIQAAVLVTSFAGAGAVPAGPKAQLQSTPPAMRRINVAAIANAHLFGEAPSNATGDVNASEAPQTSMPLVLTGIIAADEPSNGLALIGESAASAKVRAVGDSLPGGAKLHSVHSDRVLLDRGGRLESLTLPRQVSSTAPPPQALPAASENSPVDRMRRLIAEEPGALSEVMRPQPVFAQGKQRGYRVYPGRNREAFTRLGLRPGDLVTAINGTPLDDPARGQEIFRTIGSSSEARVTVMRNGRQQDLTLNMSQVASEAEQLAGAEDAAAAEPTPAEPSDDGE